ncbi:MULTISPECIES: hypothetical protein [unclassified Mucilaginibacter]|uniref:hypothetical protein n=1 Tax=unclassified Mucilaginibacter TaxID=2617802 RepID=UPI0031F6996D
MKNIKSLAAIALIAASLTACGGNGGENKNVGGSTDTANAVEGSNAGNETTGSSMTTDSTGKDSTSMSEGNAKPDGRPQQ